MATDGVKIIDGDRAHDTYWGIMDLYDSDVDFEVIENEYPLIQPDFIDEFDNEIYVTSCALAVWEIGRMTEERLQYVKSIIDKGACVLEWSKYNAKDGKARKKELDKFWTKISTPNAKIRKRKKYRKITKLYLNPDDLLTFQLKDGRYGAVICTSIDQHRGQCNYILVPTTYISQSKPTVSDLRDKEILGRQIGSGYDKQTTRELQPDIDKIWQLENGIYFFGIVQLAVDHKSFSAMKDKFEKIGSLKIFDGLKRMGMFGYESTFDRFETIFNDLDQHAKVFQLKKYPVSVLCEV
jgi:hypothetical protein